MYKWMETSRFLHRLVSWSGTALFAASTLALVTLCWSGGDSDADHRVPAGGNLEVGTVVSSVDDNVSGSTVHADTLCHASRNSAPGKRWLLHSLLYGRVSCTGSQLSVLRWHLNLPLMSMSMSVRNFQRGFNSGAITKTTTVQTKI